MYEPNVEEIVSYLSTKLNKIFYDREFVSCVSNDFHKLRCRGKNKCCVLVFPVLGQVYLRALRYQAKLLDLATFGLSGRTFQTIAVCKKEYLLDENSPQLLEVNQKMPLQSISSGSDNSVKKRRPERQLYIPPAQRKLASHRDARVDAKSLKSIGNHDLLSNEGVKPKLDKLDNKSRKHERSCKVNSKVEIEKEQVVNKYTESDSVLKKCKLEKPILSLHDLMHLNFLQLPKFSCNVIRKIDDQILSFNNFHRSSCEFHLYLSSNCENPSQFPIQIYHLYDTKFFTHLINNYFCWQPLLTENLLDFDELIENNCAIPFFNFIKNADTSEFLKSDLINFTLNQMKLCSKIKANELNRQGILQIDSVSDECETETIFKEDLHSSNILRIVCENELYDNLVDLSDLRLGHYFKILDSDGSEYLHICDELHDIQKCYMEVKQKLETPSIKQDTTSNHDSKSCSEKLNISNPESTKTEEGKINLETSPHEVVVPELIKNPNVNVSKDSNATKTKNKHEEEKEIMRKAKENINRKTRPLMKYSDDNDDLLKIDKQDNVNDWEDLFDEDGQIQEELLSEIVQKVGKDLTIVKATEDYTPYMRKPVDDLEHVVEIYNFPPSLNTGDIIHAFNMFDSDAMYILWIDSTHALLVLGSSSQAQKAMELNNPLIKVRSMTNASPCAMAAASKYDLKPAMKRPPTNLQTARRLITNHLGTKSSVSKEQSAKEREHLRKAREQRNIAKQNEKDAWEGNIRSALR